MGAEQIDYDYQPNLGGGMFLNLKSKGDKITIRLMQKPITYFVHWLENRPVICEDPKACETCISLEGLSVDEMKQKENAQKKRRQVFVWPVIDREDGEAKVFKSGVSIFLAIGEFARDLKWGGADKDATKFDITITRTEQSLQNFYSVVPDPTSLVKEITKEEKTAADKLSPLIDSVVTGKAVDELEDKETESKSVAEAEAGSAGTEEKEGFIEGLEKDKKEEAPF